MFFKRLLSLLLFSSQVSLAASFNLNDVSYLFPLPERFDQNDRTLISPQENKLFPQEIYLKLPSMNMLVKAQDLYPSLRVVGVRIDPCGVNPEGDSGCDPHIRMIWQAIEKDENGKTSTLDAGMHTFYRLTQKQMQKLKQDLLFLKLQGLKAVPAVDTENLPLSIHPGLVHPQFKKQFLSSLRKILFKYCSDQNLIHATVVQIAPNPISHTAAWWEFFGIQKKISWNRIQIARTEGSVSHGRFEMDQKIFNESPDMDETNQFPVGMKTAVTSVDLKQENILELISGSHEVSEKDRSLAERTIQVVRRFQNPKFTTIQTLDCAQCHLASPTEVFISKKFKSLRELMGDRYQNPEPARFNLQNTSVARLSTKILRSFGYWKSYPALNERVIHESAESAHYFNLEP